jgi:hypothetical protein
VSTFFAKTIRWTGAFLGAAVAFAVGGLLVGFPYRDPGAGIFGVKNWLIATLVGALVGTLIAPPGQQRNARDLFITIPVLVPAIFLLASIVTGAFQPIYAVVLIEGIVGGLIAWIFLRKV